jgi:hypothetical protein
VTLASFLIGSYMILCEQATPAAVAAAIQPILDRMVAIDSGPRSFGEQVSFMDLMEAIHSGKAQGWLDFVSEEPDVDRCIDPEEYNHYDNPANGKIHVIIPSQLVAFPCPSDIPVDPASGVAPQWVDAGGERHFGADYYADILGDFDVQLVVRSDAPAAYDEAAFAARGIAIERLGDELELRPERLLHEVDRFLTLARVAPGALGMHGGREVGLGRGGELLVSSLLIKRHAFRARPAIAWLRITHPGPATRYVVAYSALVHSPPPPPPPRPAPRRGSIAAPPPHASAGGAGDAAARPRPRRGSAPAALAATADASGGGGGGEVEGAGGLWGGAVGAPTRATSAAPAVFEPLEVMGECC